MNRWSSSTHTHQQQPGRCALHGDRFTSPHLLLGHHTYTSLCAGTQSNGPAANPGHLSLSLSLAVRLACSITGSYVSCSSDMKTRLTTSHGAPTLRTVLACYCSAARPRWALTGPGRRGADAGGGKPATEPAKRWLCSCCCSGGKHFRTQGAARRKPTRGRFVIRNSMCLYWIFIDTPVISVQSCSKHIVGGAIQ